MDTLFSFTWWFAFWPQWLPWLVACQAIGVLALPSTLWLFRRTPDEGSMIAIPVGVGAMTWVCYVTAQAADAPGAFVLRAALVVASLAALVLGMAGWNARPSFWQRARRLVPAAALLALAAVRLPHGPLGAVVALLLIAAVGVCSWDDPLHQLRARFRRQFWSIVVAQILFAFSFVLFLNLRAYLAWATFELQLWQAEKWGNLMFITSAMRATTMPIPDLWLLGQPVNYYTGAHLVTASLGKLVGAEPEVAFNLGLATIFSLSLLAGVGATRAVLGGRRGRKMMLAWGLLGGLAVAVFGNLDGWRQVFAQPGSVWNADLLQVDFWKASRAIKGTPASSSEIGTITEFPSFSAILGDHHPHHGALPWTLLLLTAFAATARARRGAFLAAPPLREWVLASFLLGFLAMVNLWDVVVMLPLLALTVLADPWLKAPPMGLLLLSREALVAVSVVLVALLLNTGLEAVWLFPSAVALAVALALSAMVGMVWEGREWTPVAAFLAAALPLALDRTMAPGAATEGSAMLIAAGVRDALVIVILRLAWSAAIVPWARPMGALGMGILAGVFAQLVAMPFLRGFISPLTSPERLLESAFPPRLNALFEAGVPNFATAFWRTSPINPFPAELRTAPADFFAHWGLFFIPALLLIFAAIIRQFGRLDMRVIFGLSAAFVALGAMAVNGDHLIVGGGALCLAVACFVLSLRDENAIAFRWLAVAFFWVWFVEVLHFDDDYAGDFERYNSLFKIYYPLWPILAVVAIVSLQQIHWSLSAVLVPAFLIAGLQYPVAATWQRTRQLGAASVTTRPWEATRTLNALDHLQFFPDYKDDREAGLWARGNFPPGTILVEATTEDAYSQAGRICVIAGLPSVLAWKHHEHQWRGRARLLRPAEIARFAPFVEVPAMLQSVTDLLNALREGIGVVYESEDPTRVLGMLRRWNAKIVVLGALERKIYPRTSLMRFEAMGFRVVHNTNPGDPDRATLLLAVPGVVP